MSIGKIISAIVISAFGVGLGLYSSFKKNKSKDSTKTQKDEPSLNNEEKILYAHIDSDIVREIFLDLVSFSKNLKKFTCEARIFNPGIKDFKYVDYDGKYAFAFIVNKKDLLFYIRKKALEINPKLRKFLKSSVLRFSENPSGEFTAHVETREHLKEVKRILEYY